MALLLALYLHVGSIGAGLGDQADRGDESIALESGFLIVQEDGVSTLLTE